MIMPCSRPPLMREEEEGRGEEEDSMVGMVERTLTYDGSGRR